MTDRLFVIVEDSDYGLSTTPGDLITDEAKALATVDEMRRDAESASIPVWYRLFELTEITA